jgi:orotidine-5'-phosphate decarboxylase
VLRRIQLAAQQFQSILVAESQLQLNRRMHNPILVALDLPTAEAALAMTGQLADLVGGFKIGSELFTTAGPDVVRRVRATGAAVFLDLKFHDIPNTVARGVAAATQLDVQMLTVHTSGGLEMMRAAETSAQETARKSGRTAPLLLGVTVLTSMDCTALAETGCDINVGKQVERLAALAVKAGLRPWLPSDVRLVTPGIRAGTEPGDDQKRTLRAREALEAGANWLVIGRPIYAAKSPRAAAEALLESIAGVEVTSKSVDQ